MEETTEDPERLFRVTSDEITLRREEDGRTRRYEGVPVDWIMERDSEEVPFNPAKAVEDGTRRGENGVEQLFTREEALRFLEKLEEEWTEGEHRLESVPLPASEEDIRIGPARGEGFIELEGVEAAGIAYLYDAERTGWERRDGAFLVETTLELPVGLAERLEKRDAARYIGRLEEMAEAVSDAPNPASVDTELPF
jgi:hypothetical protein